MTRTHVLMLLAFSPMLLASKCRKQPEEMEPEIVDISEPEIELQVISIDPATGEPGTPYRAKLYGSAFQSGAQVYFDGTAAAAVTYESPNSLAVTVPGLDEGSYNVEVMNPSGERAVLRRGVVIRSPRMNTDACKHLTVYFDLDSSRLNNPESAKLSAQIACLQSAGGTIRLEGHCDDRGTTEYNLALGDRRAQAVERYLANQGLPPSRLDTISYGEERPAVSGQGESAWAKNRRVELKVVE